ncbi:hypothetical protein C0991_000981 [Blastosporella zonata]|nr:hypothetical protein C0991_000981 [Blastosporella zonata]
MAQVIHDVRRLCLYLKDWPIHSCDSVSANLADITKDSKYTNAAIASANWIKAHNLNNGIVLDTVNGHDCSRSPSTWLFTYNTGKYIEGLSVLADVTGDSQWRTLMVNTVAASVKSSAWEGSDGIITEGASTTSNNDGVGFKGSSHLKLNVDMPA